MAKIGSKQWWNEIKAMMASQGFAIPDVRRRLNDSTGVIWTDDDLLGMYDEHKSTHGVIAACMEQLAMDPELARKWEQGGVKYTHYDYTAMAKYHCALAERSNDG